MFRCFNTASNPKQHYLLGHLLPSLNLVAKTMVRDSGSSIQISGAQALHLLGLTTQVPTQAVYLTDGRSKVVHIGNAVLNLKHVSSKIMAGAGSKVGMILQAIRYLSKDNVTDTIIKKLSNQLNKNDKKQLKNLIRYAPGWSKPKLDLLLAT